VEPCGIGGAHQEADMGQDPFSTQDDEARGIQRQSDQGQPDLEQEDVDRLVFPGPAEHPPTHEARPDADRVGTGDDADDTDAGDEPPSVIEPR
jgi:hypothetical protein